MYPINGARVHAQQSPAQSANMHADIPFSDIVLTQTCRPDQTARLQQAMRTAWNGAAQVRHLDVTDVGLVNIHSSARLVPRSVESLTLDDNAYLTGLPNALPAQLRKLSVRNVTALRDLPDGLTIEVAGSGLTTEYIRLWAARHPSAGVGFMRDGVAIDLQAGGERPSVAQPARPGWTAGIQRDYERDRYGADYVAARDR